MAVRQFSTEELSNEVWKSIPGYEGIYSVSSLGQVRRDQTQHGRTINRLCKPNKTVWGYFGVHICKQNISRPYSIHKLVMLTFVGSRPVGTEINHKDGDKTNNRLDNLEYVSKSENYHHAISLGLKESIADRVKGIQRRTARGEQKSNAKLTDAMVRIIRQLDQSGVSRVDIAIRFNVRRGCIDKVVRRKAWAHVAD